MARPRRIKKDTDAHYHLMSRTNDRRFLFENGEVKSELVSALRCAAEFCGVEIKAYAAMNNHFHGRHVNVKWAERAEKWSKATKNVMWREYWGCASGYPRQNSLVAAEDLKWINSKLSFTRVYSETIPDLDNRGAKQKGSDYRGRWDASAMEHWVISRLMWNPYVPVEKYRDGL